MNIDEMLFNRAYHIETLWLQHSWNAEKVKDYNRRDKALEKASGARPKVFLEEVSNSDWEQEVANLTKICTCGKTIEQVCPVHGTDDLDVMRP